MYFFGAIKLSPFWLPIDIGFLFVDTWVSERDFWDYVLYQTIAMSIQHEDQLIIMDLFDKAGVKN